MDAIYCAAPQGVVESLVAVTSITPTLVSPLVKFANASSARLKPTPEVSMAVIRIDTPVDGFVTFQQEPQLGESHTMSKAPPMNGKEGTSPNVGNCVSRPKSPLEHATPSIEPSELSNVGSNVARRGEGVGRLGCGCDSVGGAEGEGGMDSAGKGADIEGENEKLGGAADSEGSGVGATEKLGVGNASDGDA